MTYVCISENWNYVKQAEEGLASALTLYLCTMLGGRRGRLLEGPVAGTFALRRAVSEGLDTMWVRIPHDCRPHDVLDAPQREFLLPLVNPCPTFLSPASSHIPASGRGCTFTLGQPTLGSASEICLLRLLAWIIDGLLRSHWQSAGTSGWKGYSVWKTVPAWGGGWWPDVKDTIAHGLRRF